MKPWKIGETSFVGEYLKQLRGALSQEDVAGLTGITPQYQGHLEQGKSTPNFDLIVREVRELGGSQREINEIVKRWQADRKLRLFLEGSRQARDELNRPLEHDISTLLVLALKAPDERSGKQYLYPEEKERVLSNLREVAREASAEDSFDLWAAKQAGYYLIRSGRKELRDEVRDLCPSHPLLTRSQGIAEALEGYPAALKSDVIPLLEEDNRAEQFNHDYYLFWYGDAPSGWQRQDPGAASWAPDKTIPSLADELVGGSLIEAVIWRTIRSLVARSGANLLRGYPKALCVFKERLASTSPDDIIGYQRDQALRILSPVLA